MARKIYMLEYGTLNNHRQEFQFHRKEVYSSLKLARHHLKNSIDCNNGYGIQVEGDPYETYRLLHEMHTYNCVSTDNEPMRNRIVLTSHRLNNH